MTIQLTRLPSLASDYSGACSVLYAMQALTLLYSPGGCSSAIIECDEIRDLRQTLFFCSKLGELEAVMGAADEFRLQAQTLCAYNRQAEFTAIIGTTVPALTGTDIATVADELSRQTGLPAMALSTEGFKDYYSGVHQTLLDLGKRFLEKREKKNNQVNIIGYTPLSLGSPAHLIELMNELEACGLTINGSPLAKMNLGDFKKMSAAALNIVVSHEGAGLAQYMEQEYEIPYVLHVPIGMWGMRRLFKTLEAVTDISLGHTSRNQYAQTGKALSARRTVVIGEPLFASCMAACLQNDFGLASVEPVSLIKIGRRMKSVYQEESLSGVRFFTCEHSLAQWLEERQPDIVIGDPLYQTLVRQKNIQYVPLPHVGLSGSMHADLNYEFIGKKGYDYLAGFIGL